MNIIIYMLKNEILLKTVNRNRSLLDFSLLLAELFTFLFSISS